MKFSPISKRSLKKLAPVQETWTVVGTVFLLVLFAWTAWQTQRLDKIRQDRLLLEEELAYQEQQWRDAHEEWLAETTVDRVTARAKRELGMVDASMTSRNVIVFAPEKESDGKIGRWLANLATGLDRFGEIRTAHADEGGR